MDEDEEVMLTTIDNPFNPFVQFDEWFAFDLEKGYNTCAYLARVVDGFNELEEVNAQSKINKKIQEIVDLNLLGIYCKITIDGTKLVINPEVNTE